MEIKNKNIVGSKPIAFDKNMKDYSKDPYFVKKNKEAIKFLKKAGLPERLGKKEK